MVEKRITKDHSERERVRGWCYCVGRRESEGGMTNSQKKKEKGRVEMGRRNDTCPFDGKVSGRLWGHETLALGPNDQKNPLLLRELHGRA